MYHNRNHMYHNHMCHNRNHINNSQTKYKHKIIKININSKLMR